MKLFDKSVITVLCTALAMTFPMTQAMAAEEAVTGIESTETNEEQAAAPAESEEKISINPEANEEETEKEAEEDNSEDKTSGEAAAVVGPRGEKSAPVYDEKDLKRNTEKADSYDAIIYGNEDWDDVGPAVDDKYGGLSVKDYNALVRMVYAEAGGEGEEGMLLVANVILNRTKSYKYPVTVTEVISQNGQFQPYATGRYAEVEPSETAVKAVKRALAGENNAPGVLYFKSVHSKAVWANKTVAFRYKNHIFYY